MKILKIRAEDCEDSAKFFEARCAPFFCDFLKLASIAVFNFEDTLKIVKIGLEDRPESSVLKPGVRLA